MRPKLEGFENALARIGQFLVAYLMAGIVETIVFSEMRGGGHPDAPLSRFPEYLLLAPVVPIWTASDLVARHSSLDLVSTGVFIVCFVAAWFTFRKVVPWEMS
jgi:hypothetical protein